MTDFFISYNSADRPWAEWIAWQLEDTGYTTVLQAWDFRPGSNFVVAMQQAAGEAERLIAVLSPDYLDARFTQPEWAAAFAQDPTGKKGSLLPVRVRGCLLQGLLPQIIYIDLVGLAEAPAKGALLAGVRRERAKPAAAPYFPGRAPQAVGERPRFPGALPPIWNIPHLRNPHFTGRDNLLAALRTALLSGQPAALTQALTGLGGVGKTQLAVEYAYRFATDYTVVWWVHSEELATLATDYAALAGPLQLPEHTARQPKVVVATVRRWLEQHTGWLLVFDNADGPADVRDCLPRGATGHVLVTSRNQNWRGVASPLVVPVLERPEATAFLERRTGQAAKAAAEALAAELGELPLALEQAGAYIEATGLTLTQYLDRFAVYRQELLRCGTLSTNYPDTVATTWEMAFQHVQQATPVAAALLNLCAFLAPDAIPRDLLQAFAAAGTSPLEFDVALAALRRYSLLEGAGEALVVHRLVQIVTYDRLTLAERKTWAEAAVQLVAQAFHFNSDNVQQTRRADARLVPHALAALEHAETLQVAQKITMHLQDRVRLLLPEGTRVRVRHGVLAGVEGIVVAGQDRQRVVISVDLIQQTVAVDIDRGDIEPLNSEAE